MVENHWSKSLYLASIPSWEFSELAGGMNWNKIKIKTSSQINFVKYYIAIQQARGQFLNYFDVNYTKIEIGVNHNKIQLELKKFMKCS